MPPTFFVRDVLIGLCFRLSIKDLFLGRSKLNCSWSRSQNLNGCQCLYNLICNHTASKFNHESYSSSHKSLVGVMHKQSPFLFALTQRPNPSLKHRILTGRVVVPTGRVVVPTGRVVVPTGRVVVPTGKVIIIVSPGRLSPVPTGRVLSPDRSHTYRNGGNENGGNGENGNGNRNRNHGMNYGGFMPVARECTFQDFLKCKPHNFLGTKGVVGLTRWFEKMETVFNISNSPPKYQVKYATCILQDSALTWWNSHKRTIGVDAAYAMKWDGLIKLMTEVYCPRNEIQKMETELWNLTVKGNDLTAYTQGFRS
ncbi:reverse transcriptase domain-containing protein [Tanacetum coccineum]